MFEHSAKQAEGASDEEIAAHMVGKKTSMYVWWIVHVCRPMQSILRLSLFAILQATVLDEKTKIATIGVDGDFSCPKVVS